MSDDLDNTVSSARGQSPSPDFVAALRERIVAESKTQPQTGIAPVTELEVASLKEQGMTTTRKMTIGLVAAAIILVVGFATIGNGNDSDEVNITDRPAETTSTTASTTSSGEPSAEDLLGTWNASFGPTWQIEADQIAVTGGSVTVIRYIATDTRISVSDATDCPTGTYDWQIEGDVLTLTVVEDNCGGRQDNWNGATFDRSD